MALTRLEGRHVVDVTGLEELDKIGIIRYQSPTGIIGDGGGFGRAAGGPVGGPHVNVLVVQEPRRRALAAERKREVSACVHEYVCE